MPPGELADLQPPAEVVALGRPEQLFRAPPALRTISGTAGQAVAMVLIAVPILVGGYLLSRRPVDLGMHPAVVVLIAFSCFGIAGLAAFFMFKSDQIRSSPAYAFFPEALALWQDEKWSVIRWEEIDQFQRDPQPSLLLRDGSKIILQNLLFDTDACHKELTHYTSGERAVPARGGVEAIRAGQSAGHPAPVPRPSRVFMDELREIFVTRSPRARRDLGIALVIFLLGCGILLYQWRWIASAVAGPRRMTMAELRNVNDPAELANPWVELMATNAVETDLTYVEKSKFGSNTKSKFYFIQVEDRWLIAETPPDHQGGIFVGYLDVWGTPLRKQAVEAMRARVPAGGTLLPFQFDGEYGYRSQCAAFVGLVLLFFFGGAAFMVITAWSKALEDRQAALKLTHEQ